MAGKALFSAQCHKDKTLGGRINTGQKRGQSNYVGNKLKSERVAEPC